jgi:UPF0755 protein
VLVVVAFALLVLVGAVLVGVVGSRVLGGGGGNAVTTGETKEIIIPPGMSAGDVAALLEQQEIIDSTTAFLLDVRLADASTELKSGTYHLTVGQDHTSLIEDLTRGGEAPSVSVTIPEGLSIDQTASLLSETPTVDGGEYADRSRTPADFDVPKPGGVPLVPAPSDLEGLLFPDTYRLTEREGADALIALQLAAFDRQTADLPWERSETLGLSPYEIVTVASLIEKEVRVPEERTRVASVIYNRLARDMSLGIDATVRFAVDKWTGPLTQSDLDVDSPYNTRRNKGLPPGPICSPGLDALEAALDPEQSDYLYYVLQDDEGHHFFTDSYEEFLAAKEQSPAQN